MKPVKFSQRRHSAGFSLIELMVALTLSMILMAGALSILYSTKLTSSENERLARVQEAGRTAFELIRQDARAAGYLGCAKPRIDRSLNPPTSTFSNGLNSTSLLWNFGFPVSGFEATSATVWTPVLDAAIPAVPVPAGGNDVLVLRAARPGSPVFRTNAVFNVGDPIPVDRDPNATLTVPVSIVISDCKGATVFMATDFAATGGTATIKHATGGAPGNSSSDLLRSFSLDSLVQPVQTVIYYVASCTAVNAPVCPAITPPALWQIVGGGTPQELIQGVEGMQLLYGVDTDGDQLANSYQKANAVADWSTVVSVNIAVLARSIDETGVEKDKQTYKLLGGAANNGADYGPFNDRRQRQIFTTTITLRNATT